LIKSKNSERKITNHLQQDVVKISGKTIFINPFLYWRRFDDNTNRWLREPGQMSEDQIYPNRNRFYPEIEWADLSHEQKLIKDATVEMFLKTLELISTFHPQLNSGQLLEIERKMAITKKIIEIANIHSKGRVISFLEGGYDLQALSESIIEHLKGLESHI